MDESDLESSYKNFKVNVDYELKKKLDDHKDTEKLIEVNDLKKYMKMNSIKIATITIHGRFLTKINSKNIAYYMDLDKDGICEVHYGKRENIKTNRFLDEVVKKPKKKPKKIFYNQVTVVLSHNNKGGKETKINVKLFNSGVFHIVGCKNMTTFYEVLEKIINLLKETKTKIKKCGEIKTIKYVHNINKLEITNIKIAMINSEFKINNMIDRDKLYYYLCMNEISCKNTQQHACVNIKYTDYIDGKVISIFVFQSGSIIITGARNIGHIVTAHSYIMKIIKHYNNKLYIVKADAEIIKTILNKNKQFKNIKIFN